MSILRKIVVDVSVNTKESIDALDKLSKATKSYREDTKVFKEFSKEQGKSISLYEQQMGMVDNYKKKVKELKKAKEEELKVYEDGIKKTFGKGRDELKIGDVESKELEKYSKQLEEITKKTAKYTEELGKTEQGSEEYQRTVKKMNDLDEERTEIIKRSQIEADITYNSMQSNLRSYEVDIDKHGNELSKLERTYDNLRQSSDAFSDSIRRQGDALKGANATQYKKELENFDKQYDQSMQKRRESYNTIFNTFERMGTGIVAATSMGGALATGGTMAVNKYVDHNYQELDVMRMARGNEEQNEQLRASLNETLRSNHESNEEIFGLYHELIKHVDPSEYGDKLQDMVQTGLDLSLAGDLSTAEAVSMMVKINKITEREIGDASLFHGANELQNQFGVDLGNVLQMINTSASRLSNAGWSDEDILALSGTTELLWARGNESAARGLAEMGEMTAMATYDTSEFEKLQAYAGRKFYTQDIIDLVNGYENDFITGLETALEGDEYANIDLKKAKSEADAYQLKMDIMESYGLTTTDELNDLLETTSMGDILIQLLKGLEKLTGDGRTMAEVVDSRGYMSNNSITQEAMNNVLKSLDQFGLMKDAVTTGMDEGTSLTDEAQVFRESDKAQLELLKKEIGFLIIEIGQALTPALLNLLENLDPVKDFIIGIVDWIAELEPETIETALKSMLGLNIAGWGMKSVGFAGQTAFQISEMGEMIGNVVGKNSKGALTRTRDLAREEASLVKDLVDAMISDDVTKGVKPMSLEEYTNISKQYVQVKGKEVKITKEAAELIGKQKDSMSKLVDVVDDIDDVGDVVNSAGDTIKRTAKGTADVVGKLDDTVTKNTVGIGSKFKTFLTSLSPLTQVALAVGAIAATAYAINKVNDYLEDRADEERSWGKDSTVDSETKAKYEKAIGDTRLLRYELRQSGAMDKGYTLSTEQLSGLNSYMDEMKILTEEQSAKWSKLLDKDILGDYAEKALGKMNENKELIDEYKTILEDIKKNNGVASDKQLERLGSIDQRLAQTLDESEGGDGAISRYINNNQLIGNMDTDERIDLVTTMVEDLESINNERLEEIKSIRTLREISKSDSTMETISLEELQMEEDKINKDYFERMYPDLAKTDYIRSKTKGIRSEDSLKLDEYNWMFSDTSEEDISLAYTMGLDSQTLIKRAGEIFGVVNTISEVLNDVELPMGDSKNTKEGIFKSLLSLLEDGNFLMTVEESRVAVEAFAIALDEVGVRDFYAALPDLLVNEEFKSIWEGMNKELTDYVEGLDNLYDLSREERNLYISSNLTEAQLEIMNTKNLWESEPFTEHLLGVVLRGEDVTKAINAVKTEVDANGQTIIIDADIVNAQLKLDTIRNRIKQLNEMSDDIKTKTRVRSNTIVNVPRYTGGTVFNHALGTNYHPGGTAILGDGFEPELVYEPGKAPYMSAMVPTKYDLSRGTVVIPYSKIPEASNIKPPLYNNGVGSMSSVVGDTYTNEITVNAYTDNVDVGLIQRELTKYLRDEELNKRRIKVSGGES